MAIMETGKKNYILYFDLLNIFACFAVVALHVNGAVHTFAKTRNWVSCMFIEALFYFAVPVFFMLTGATLINYRKRYGTGTFFKKRLLKTLVPFIISSIIGICWSVFYTKGMTISDINTPAKFISAVINCKGMGIYWFFPALFSVYLTIPLFSLVDEDKEINGEEKEIVVNEDNNGDDDEIKDLTHGKVLELLKSKDKVKAAKQLEILVGQEVELPREFYFAGLEAKGEGGEENS